MNQHPLLLFFAIATPTALHCWFLDPSTIRVANKAPLPLYAAFYYVSRKGCARIADPVMIPAQNAVLLEPPTPQFLSTRRLAVALAASDLTPDVMPACPATAPVGLLCVNDFTARLHPVLGNLHLMPTADWLAAEEEQPLQPRSLARGPLAAEEAFAAARSRVVHARQEAWCAHTLSAPISIALCASGGGFRAMFATAGVMLGLEELGILPLMQECVCLSGSTWFLFPWLLSGKTVADYTHLLVTLTSQGLIHHLVDQYHHLATLIAAKKARGQKVSGIDLYGISLAYTLLKPLATDALHLTLDTVAAGCSADQHPLIRGTLVSRPTPGYHYEWITCSPFAITFLDDFLTLPPALLGAQFHNLQQISVPLAPSLGYMLGIFGSSFSLSFRDALERLPDGIQPLLRKVLPKEWHTHHWSNAKITAAHIPNPRYQTDHVSTAHTPAIALVDGGYLNNLPLEPCVRAAHTPHDIIIVLDAKQNQINRLTSLQLAYTAARTAAPELPMLDEEAIRTRPLSIHQEHAGPAIVYCTLEGDALFNPAADPRYSTPRLIYGREQAERLVSFVKEAVLAQGPALTALIRTHAARRATNGPPPLLENAVEE